MTKTNRRNILLPPATNIEHSITINSFGVREIEDSTKEDCTNLTTSAGFTLIHKLKNKTEKNKNKLNTINN